MAMIAIYGIHFFGPLLFGMFSLLLPLVGVAGFLFWRKQRKKIQKEKSGEQKTVFDFSHALSQKKTFWEQTKSEHANVYTSQYYNWCIKIQEHTNYQTAHIYENGRIVANATYHPAFNSITNVNHFLMNQSNDEAGRDAIASIWHLFIEQSFTSQTVDSLDEEASFRYIWERIRTLQNSYIEKDMREFQETYAQLYRYEFKMNQQETKMWKHGLFLVRQIFDMDITLDSLSNVHTTLQYVTKDLQTMKNTFEKTFPNEPKQMSQTPNEWEEMRCVVTTWNEMDQIVYEEYETCYRETMCKFDLSKEKKRRLQNGKENIYNTIHHPATTLPILRNEMAYMKEVCQVRESVSVENE